MTTENKSMKSYLSFEPTTEQANALEMCEQLINNCNQDFLVIRGAAGTGKSSIIEAITSYMFNNDKAFVLAAPTVKACQVIQRKTGYRANTIHSIAFKAAEENTDFFKRKQNAETKRTLFIVDEASMISDIIDPKNENFKTNRPILSGLIEFVKEGNKENQIIFIGDHYQLPPIDGSKKSVALSKNYLSNIKKLQGEMIALTEVKRQDADSYILKFGTYLRHCIENNFDVPKIDCKYLNNSTAALNQYMQLYNQTNLNKVVLVANRNIDVSYFNSMVRNKLHFAGNQISVGDQVTTDSNYIGNSTTVYRGQNGIVKAVSTAIEKFAEVQFTEVEIDFFDSANDVQTINTLVRLDSLQNEEPTIKKEKDSYLKQQAYANNSTLRHSKKTSDDKYLSALQLNFAYATNCHKAQGSEWENVIVNPYYFNDCRWLYTAITRASKELYTYNKKI